MKKLNVLLQLTRYGMGNGNQELAIKLIGNYFRLILEDSRSPSIIVFYNEGVKLLEYQSPVGYYLKNLERSGIKLLACKTCLDYYNINEMCAGIKGTMMDIITLQIDAQKIINL